MMSLFFKFRLIFETVIYSFAAEMVKVSVIESGFKALDYFYKFGLRNVCILYYKSKIQTTNTINHCYEELKMWPPFVLGFVCYEIISCF